MSVTVSQVPTFIGVSPPTWGLSFGGTETYTAVVLDQFRTLMSGAGVTWSLASGSVGSINAATGVYTAGTTPGTATVIATSGAATGTAAVTVNDAPPAVATPASATPSSPTGTTAVLSVLGAYAGGESGLTYTWSSTGPATVTYSANGTNAAKTTTATFTAAGSYVFTVTIADAYGGSAASSVDVTVVQTPATLTVSPSAVSVDAGAMQPFTASVCDQFGAVLGNAGVTWTESGGGTVSSMGVYTAPSTSETDTVTATCGLASATATVTVTSADGPMVVTAASASPNPVPGTTTVLSVLGSDVLGESSLTYTWAETSGPAAVTYSDNGTNSAKNTTATFIQAGRYDFIVTLTDGMRLSTTSSMTVTVNQTPTTVAVSPPVASVSIGGTQPFSETLSDQFGNAITDTSVIWSANGGSIDGTGLYSAGTTPGTATVTALVTAASGTATGTAAVTVNDVAPTVATTASATPLPVTGTSASLSVLGAYIGGESKLTYTWSASPSLGVTFLPNNSNVAKNAMAMFTQAGTYGLTVTITDGYGGTAASTVIVVVNQTPTAVTVSPPTASVIVGGTQTFTPMETDQFGNVITNPSVTWSVTGNGTITSSGVFTAPDSVETDTVKAVVGGLSATATVSIMDPGPTVATPASATPNPVNGTTANLSVLGAYAGPGGEGGLTYTWGFTGNQPASVTFSANGTNAAKNMTATFVQAGSYNFQVTISDSHGDSVTSGVTVVVEQTPVVTVTPNPASVNVNGTQGFSASAVDQFGSSISGLSFAWSVQSGVVGSIGSSSGLNATYVAGPMPGTATVQATATVGVTGIQGSGTANVTVSDSGPVTLTSLTLAQMTLQAGTIGTGAVTLSGAAAVDTTVTLSSDDPSTIVPSSVVIPSGQSSASFSISSNESDQTFVTISASYSGVTDTANLKVSPAIALTATATGASKITLYWPGVSGAVGYNIYRSTSEDGPYLKLNSAPYNTADTGPNVSNMFMYSDTGLMTGTQYFYYVAAVDSSGAQGLKSDTDDAIPDSNAIAWDTGDATTIVSQVQTMVNSNLNGDETAVGKLIITGPDGVAYEGFTDGSAPQAYASPGYFDSNLHTFEYVDGSEMPAPIDSEDPQEGIDDIAGSSAQNSGAGGTSPPDFTPALGITYAPTLPPTGVFREVQTLPGHTCFMSYVGLPDPLNSTTTNVDGRKGGTFLTGDTGCIYTGGTAYNISGSKSYNVELDAGLFLYQSSDPNAPGHVGHPGWQPFCSVNGWGFTTGITGLPLEQDQAAASAHASPTPTVFVTGEPLMSFKVPGYGTIPDKVIILSIYALDDGNVFAVDKPTGVRTSVGDITLVRAGIKGWKRSSTIVLKRMNSIAQSFKIVGAAPPAFGPYEYSPFPNGPGAGFFKSGSYIYGASWGDFPSNPDALIDGVTLFPGSNNWTPQLTWLEGSYPGPGNPSPSTAYVSDLQQNQYYWEQDITVQTTPYQYFY